MKKINFRKTLFAAVLLFQLNAIAAFGQTVVKGSVKDNTGKPLDNVPDQCSEHNFLLHQSY